jgi:hypothetical protein
MGVSPKQLSCHHFGQAWRMMSAVRGTAHCTVFESRLASMSDTSCAIGTSDQLMNGLYLMPVTSVE